MNVRYTLLNLSLIVAMFFLIGGGYYYMIGYVLYLLFIALSLILYPQESLNAWFGKNALWLWLFLLFYFVTSSFSITGVASLFTRLSPVLLYVLYKNILQKRPYLIEKSKWIVMAIMAIMLYYCYRSFLFLQENPMGLRELISNNKDEAVVVGGGFALPYALCIVVPFVLWKLKQGVVTGFSRIVFIVFVVIGALLVAYSLYMTALIILAFGCIWVFIKDYPLDKKVIAALMVGGVVYLCYEYIPLLLNTISGDDTQVLLLRFDEISSIMSGDDISEASDFYSRILLTLSSITLFFQNPLIGVGYKGNYDSYALVDLGVGQHAQWFDIFAIYGIVALLLIAYFVNATKFYHLKARNNVAVLLFVIVGFLNPIFLFTIILVAFFVAPLIDICWNNK